MQELLEEIKASPGVLGSCVYSTRYGVLSSNLPSVFKIETQQRIVSILHRVFKLNETVKLDVNSFEVQYDEAIVLVKKLCDASSLAIICEPDANVHLINMTISMLTSDLLVAIADYENDSAPRTDEPKRQTPSQQPADPAAVMNGSLANELAMIKKALAKCIGPVAGMTLESSIKKWLKQGEPSRQRLKELAQLMLPEIDEEASRTVFLDDLRELF